MLEEIDVMVASLLDTLLRTILEITSRPQPPGPATQLPFQDVTVRSRLCWLAPGRLEGGLLGSGLGRGTVDLAEKCPHCGRERDDRVFMKRSGMKTSLISESQI